MLQAPALRVFVPIINATLPSCAQNILLHRALPQAQRKHCAPGCLSEANLFLCNIVKFFLCNIAIQPTDAGENIISSNLIAGGNKQKHPIAANKPRLE